MLDSNLAMDRDVVRLSTLHNHGGRPIQRPGFSEPGLAWPIKRINSLTGRLNCLGWSWITAAENGWLKSGIKRRVLRRVRQVAPFRPSYNEFF